MFELLSHVGIHDDAELASYLIGLALYGSMIAVFIAAARKRS